MVNWASLAVGKQFARHYHEDMQEIFILVEGAAEITVGMETATLCRGDAVVIAAREIHQMRNAGTEAVEYLAIGISSEAGGRTIVVEDGGLPPFAPPIIPLLLANGNGCRRTRQPPLVADLETGQARPQPVPGQQVGLFDVFAIDRGAVAGVEITNQQRAVDLADLAMHSADPTVIQADIGIRVPTNNNRQPAQDESDFGAVVAQANQFGFHRDLRRKKRAGKWGVCAVARAWEPASGGVPARLRARGENVKVYHGFRTVEYAPTGRIFLAARMLTRSVARTGPKALARAVLVTSREAPPRRTRPNTLRLTKQGTAFTPRQSARLGGGNWGNGRDTNAPSAPAFSARTPHRVLRGARCRHREPTRRPVLDESRPGRSAHTAGQ